MTIKASLLRLLDEGRIPAEFLLPKGGINQSALARALGIKPSAVNQWFSTGTKWPHPALQRQLAKLLGVALTEVGEPDVVDFDTLPAPAGAPSGAVAFPLAAFTQMPKDLPVWGTGRGGPEGSFLFNAHEAVDYMRRPPALEGVKDAFAIYVEGDSMEPWRVAGDPVHVNPARPPSPGSHVLIELHPNGEGDNTTAMVKKLIRRTASFIIVSQYNPPAEIEIPAGKIKAIYRVMELRELLLS